MATIATEITFAKQDFENAFNTSAIGHHFQGIVNLETGKLQYFEALARWTHPSMGLITAARFVQSLANHGFIAKLTEIAVDSTRQYVEWVSSQGMLPLPVSINITATEFEHPNYADYFCNLLEKAKLPVHLVNIEMLEWGNANDLVLVGKVVAELKERGIKVFADDFGHAYGSFHRMMNISYSGIKLDCEYARVIENRLEAQVIIESMARVSQRLEISFVVEGIETLAQSKSLQMLGVKTGQGYLFHRPMHWLEVCPLLEPNPAA